MKQLLLGACLMLAVCPTVLAADDIKPQFRNRRWEPVSVPWQHIEPRDGRRFYRGPRSLRNWYPYLILANSEERAQDIGYELRLSNVHRLLKPVATEEAAVELARLFAGGQIVRDLATYDRIANAVEPLASAAKHWRVALEDGRPTRAGLHSEVTDTGFAVTLLVYTSSGYGALNIEEQRYQFPTGDVAKRRVKTWISGPPQSWQTSGNVDMDLQKAMRAEVDRFRQAATKAIAVKRTIRDVRKALKEGVSFQHIRWHLGEPDREIGHKPTLFVYELLDATLVVFSVRNIDQKPLYGKHIQSLSSDGDKPRLGKTIAEVYTP